ncbi:SAM-dependent methyltransferase [Acetobacter tropicalis]|uniref:SAM-dependent methyltransferase n=1 Tax=Acetobacter tropicalis TaxID=104102 RepID=A0A149TSH0_9PROT|nr:class I SAM-dependent methyltransferase [Acetobacter tropicalis]KXV56101.1 SAM-dependent methyltransferase [Acetobacter tropicalis]
MLSQKVIDIESSENIHLKSNHGNCRLCNQALTTTVIDLGMSPLANAYISYEAHNKMEPFFPLHALICDSCYLVQLEKFEEPKEIFSDYLYFSSYSSSWLRHAKNYIIEQALRFSLTSSSLIVEIASNDGYLLQYAMEMGIGVLGIEPATTVAQVAREKGIPTESLFFGRETALYLKNKGYTADLMTANNVVAHVPDLHDFLEGFRILLSEKGVVTFEFPHLMRMIQETQFDTIYHEHFSYFSLKTIQRALFEHGLRVFDVEELPTHGGSLRVYATHEKNEELLTLEAVESLLVRERNAGLEQILTYETFAQSVFKIKGDLLEFLINAGRNGLKVVGYGAPAKGNTLLNYCGVKSDLISFTTDMNPHKQNMLLPGTHIPIFSPDIIKNNKPDFIVIFPWNLEEEIVNQLSFVSEWGGKFVIPIPELKII